MILFHINMQCDHELHPYSHLKYHHIHYLVLSILNPLSFLLLLFQRTKFLNDQIFLILHNQKVFLLVNIIVKLKQQLKEIKFSFTLQSQISSFICFMMVISSFYYFHLLSQLICCSIWNLTTN